MAFKFLNLEIMLDKNTTGLLCFLIIVIFFIKKKNLYEKHKRTNPLLQNQLKNFYI